MQPHYDYTLHQLMQKWVLKFRDVFEVDNYHPMQVNTLVEWNNVVENFPFSSQSLEESTFPGSPKMAEAFAG